MNEWNKKKLMMLREADADNSDDGIRILREIYLHPMESDTRTKEGVRIANDYEAMEWIMDFWSYVVSSTRDPPLLSEIGFDGFVDSIVDYDSVSNLLIPDGEYISDLPSDVVSLYTRLIRLHNRFTVFQRSKKRS